MFQQCALFTFYSCYRRYHSAHRRRQIQHHRAKRLDRRDPSRTLTIKRARHEILSRV
jgi:hypothetical protein